MKITNILSVLSLVSSTTFQEKCKKKLSESKKSFMEAYNSTKEKAILNYITLHKNLKAHSKDYANKATIHGHSIISNLHGKITKYFDYLKKKITNFYNKKDLNQVENYQDGQIDEFEDEQKREKNEENIRNDFDNEQKFRGEHFKFDINDGENDGQEGGGKSMTFEDILAIFKQLNEEKNNMGNDSNQDDKENVDDENLDDENLEDDDERIEEFSDEGDKEFL